MKLPPDAKIISPQAGPQLALVACPVFELFFGGARGGGKLQPITSKVVTPKGWRTIGSLCVGDKVIDPTTGGSCDVIGIYPQGSVDIYQVTFDDGATTLCGLDHLWAYKLPNHHRPHSKPSSQRNSKAWSDLGGNIPDSRWDHYRIGPLSELIDAVNNGFNPRIPLTEPVLFTVNGRTGTGPVPAYTIGLLLGDGSLQSMAMTCCDDEIRDYLLNSGFKALSELHTDGKPKTFSPDGDFRKQLKMWLHNHGLDKARSWEKFIPEYIFTAPLDYRLDVLRGLMDTDGYVDERGRCYFTSVSKRLSDGVRNLVWSLGGKAYQRIKKTHYSYKGEIRSGRIAYDLHIQMRRTSALFKMSRKRNRCTDSWNGGYEIMREVSKIEKIGQEPSICIRVSNPYGVYLTDDYIVTHNTVGMLIDFVSHAFAHNKHVTGVFFRRTAKQLEEVIKESFNFYPGFGAEWRAGTQTWEFVSGAAAGARLKFRHLWDERDAANYQGQNLTWICFEEIVNWPTPEPINLLRACLRSAAGIPVFFRATGNPGGPGHQWVKSRYIDPAPTGYRIVADEETGEQRVFIPSRLEDNRLLMRNDPSYERRILSVGGALAKAWRWGAWDIVAGGFFDDIWNPDRHVLKPFKIPPGWTYRRSFDWGSARPSALGIWAISDGSSVPELGGRVFPRGSAILIEEWYTVAHEKSGIVKPNEGLKLTNAELGAGIAQRSRGRSFSGCVADPAIFAEQGGPSIYAQMRQGAGGSLTFAPADNARVPGWGRMREFLTESAKDQPEKPGLWVFNTCTHFLRTVPVLQRDMRKPDDIDSDSEDHAADSARYLLQSLGTKQAGTKQVRGFY